MKKLKRLRKREHKPITTIFNQPGRPKIHISTICAVFSQFDERQRQINLLFNDPFGAESVQARRESMTRLYKRLEDFGLVHRFDFSSYLDTTHAKYTRTPRSKNYR